MDAGAPPVVPSSITDVEAQWRPIGVAIEAAIAQGKMPGCVVGQPLREGHPALRKRAPEGTAARHLDARFPRCQRPCSTASQLGVNWSIELAE